MSIPITIAKVAEKLDSKISTLRNYCKLLEEKGYIFERDANNNRLFSDTDIAMLSELLKQLKDRSNTREMALDKALSVDIKKNVPSVKNEDIAQNNEGDIRPHMDVLTDISKSMEYMAEHIKGLNSEVVQLRENNEQLHRENKKIIEQNTLLNDQLKDIKSLLDIPKEEPKEQQQINALMNEVRKLNSQLKEMKDAKDTVDHQENKSWWNRLFRK